MLEADNPPLALAFNPFNAEARVNSIVAELNAPSPDLELARRHATTLLQAAPGDARGYSLIGAVLEKTGETARAAEHYRHALTHSKTEIHALLSLTDNSLADQDIAGALGYIDLILRRWPGYWEEIVPVFEAAITTDAGRTRLAAELGSEPPWRGRALKALIANPPGLIFARDLLVAEGPARTPARVSEANAVIAALARHGAYADAHRLFLATRPPEQRALAGYVFDPEFSGLAAGGYFTWQAPSHGSADIKLPGPDGGLQLRFLDSPARLGTIGQTLRLPMGTYRLEIELGALQLEAPRRLYWRLDCLGGSGRLAEIDINEGSYASALLGADFAVPEAGCPAQRLTLATDIRTDSWRDRYRGEVRFSALRITRH